MSVIFILMSTSSMSHVDFKNWQRHPVEFEGQGPSYNMVWGGETCG